MEAWELWIWIPTGLTMLIVLIAGIVDVCNKMNNYTGEAYNNYYTFGEQQSQRYPIYFMLALGDFSGLLIKSDDKKCLEDKLCFIESYLLPIIGQEEARRRISEIRKTVLKSEKLKFDYSHRDRLTLDEKMILLDFLIALAASSGEITNAEMKTLRSIAERGMGISKYEFDFDIFESEYYNIQYNFAEPNSYSSESNQSSNSSNQSSNSIEDYYKILEIEPSATNDEVKRAYYDQMAKHHPDKVNHLGEHLKKFANEYCVKLNEAYERIKKKRGMI